MYAGERGIIVIEEAKSPEGLSICPVVVVEVMGEEVRVCQVEPATPQRDAPVDLLWMGVVSGGFIENLRVRKYIGREEVMDMNLVNFGDWNRPRPDKGKADEWFYGPKGIVLLWKLKFGRQLIDRLNHNPDGRLNYHLSVPEQGGRGRVDVFVMDFSQLGPHAEEAINKYLKRFEA